MTKKDTENYYIDFLRFIFSIIIVFYHSWRFSEKESLFLYGNLAVNFYFIVTGYLMVKSLINHNRDTYSFMKNKIKRLLPGIVVAFFISYAFTYGLSGLSITKFFSNDVLADFLQLRVFDYGGAINGSWWYLSTMLFVLFILYPLARKYKDEYFKYVAYMILFLTFVIIRFKNMNIDEHSYTSFIFINGFYCGIINIILGNFSYVISEKIKKINFSKDKIIVLSIIETLIYIFLIFNMNYRYIGTMWFSLLFMFNVAISFSNVSLVGKIFKSSFWKKLGNYGFYIYLTHLSIRTYLLRRNSLNYNDMLLKFLCISFIVGIITYVLAEYVYPYIKSKISLKLKEN